MPAGHNNMLSQQELRSLVRIDTPSDEQPEEAVLDLSHQDLKKLKDVDLGDMEVQKMDASYNYFRSVEAVQVREGTGAGLRWLNLSFNFVEKIDEMGSRSQLLSQLTYLNLTANRIASCDLTHHPLPHLQTLILSSNRIRFFMHCPPSLKVLILSTNQLATLAFSGGQNLTVLAAHDNLIKKVGVQLPNLLFLDLESNLVEDMQAVCDLLRGSPQLLSLNFRDNPVAKQKAYRVTALELGEQITQIDEVAINPHIREGFRVLKAQDELTDLIETVNQKYASKLAEQQKIKEDLIRKIRGQEKEVEKQYQRGVEEEKQQLEMLERKAKEILGKNRLNIVEEKKQFQQGMGELAPQEGEENRPPQTQAVQQQYLQDYLAYLQKQKPPSAPGSTPNQHRPSYKLPPLKPTTPKQPRPSLKGIKLFDLRSIESLVSNYQVNVVEM